MSEPYLGQIMAVSFNYAPRGWAMCNGQLLPIIQNSALYSLLGTNYGGDGKTTFGLPNLQGRTPICWGGSIPIGQSSGSATVTLTVNQLPQHMHFMTGYNSAGDQVNPGGNYMAGSNQGASIFTNANPAVLLNPAATTSVGGSQPHNNMQPYFTLNFCIALQGIFPSRN